MGSMKLRLIEVVNIMSMENRVQGFLIEIKHYFRSINKANRNKVLLYIEYM